MKSRFILLLTLISFQAFSQKNDSLLQVQYNKALSTLKDGNYSAASEQFSQLINSGFTNKEVYVKRGITFFQLKSYDKAKADFDEAVKARINTLELFEFRGNTKYNLNDYDGAATDLDKAV